MGKKSKRPNRVKNKDNAASAAASPAAASSAAAVATTTTTVPSCWHGAAPLEHNPMAQAQDDCLQNMIVGIPQRLASGGSFSHGVAKALEYMDSIGLMNQQMFQTTVAEGVKKQLSTSQKQRNLAGLCVHLAITMHYWLEVGGEEFLLVLLATDEKMRRKYPWFAEWSEATMNIVTERDTIKYLAKHCPFGCLDEVKKQHKKEPNMNCWSGATSAASWNWTRNCWCAANVSSFGIAVSR